MISNLRVVLDTNVVLDLLLFRDPRVLPLEAAQADGRVQMLSDGECSEELRQVLIRPLFKLDSLAQEAMLLAYRRLIQECGAQATERPRQERPRQLPKCRDRDDQKFLELAWRAGASLLTRDKDLLKMRGACARAGGLVICEPEHFIRDHLTGLLQTAGHQPF